MIRSVWAWSTWTNARLDQRCGLIRADQGAKYSSAAWTPAARAPSLARVALPGTMAEPGARARRYETLLRLLRAPPSHGGWCLEGPLAAAARLVCDDDELREKLGTIARR